MKRDRREPKGGNSRGAVTGSGYLGWQFIFLALSLVLNWFFDCQILLWVSWKEGFSWKEIVSLENKCPMTSSLHRKKREKYPGHKAPKKHLTIFLILQLPSFERKYWWAPNMSISRYDRFKRSKYENFILFKLNDLWKLPQTTIIMLVWATL